MAIQAIAAAALLMMTSVATAHAEALTAYPLDLGETRGVAYYTAEPDGFHVVATVVKGIDGTPVRASAVLSEGQALSLSIPGSMGEAATAIEIVAEPGGLKISEKTPSLN